MPPTPRRAASVIDRGWAAPGPGRGPKLPAIAKIAIVVLALAVIIVGVRALGGFEQRRDLTTSVAPGTVVATGPFELTFTRATVQKSTSYDDRTIWQVEFYGAGRTIGTESAAPPTGPGKTFLARGTDSVEVASSDYATFGDDTGTGEGARGFTPGLPSVAYRISFEFTEFFEPRDSILLAVYRLESRAPFILDTGERTLGPTRNAFVFELPMQRLPDDDN